MTSIAVQTYLKVFLSSDVTTADRISIDKAFHILSMISYTDLLSTNLYKAIQDLDVKNFGEISSDNVSLQIEIKLVTPLGNWSHSKQ